MASRRKVSWEHGLPQFPKSIIVLVQCYNVRLRSETSVKQHGMSSVLFCDIIWSSAGVTGIAHSFVNCTFLSTQVDFEVSNSAILLLNILYLDQALDSSIKTQSLACGSDKCVYDDDDDDNDINLRLGGASETDSP
jgi:hypothetical protein